MQKYFKKAQKDKQKSFVKNVQKIKIMQNTYSIFKTNEIAYYFLSCDISDFLPTPVH